jgi:hypothetical protein
VYLRTSRHWAIGTTAVMATTGAVKVTSSTRLIRYLTS